jgi:hypothetical protein
LEDRGSDVDECEEDFANLYYHDSVPQVSALDSFILCNSYKNNSHIPRLEFVKQGFPAFQDIRATFTLSYQPTGCLVLNDNSILNLMALY